MSRLGERVAKICYPYRRQHFRLETAPICSHLLVERTLLAPLLSRAPGVGSVSSSLSARESHSAATSSKASAIASPLTDPATRL